MRWRSRVARQFRYPVRWAAFLTGGVPAILVFPGPSLSYLAWFALVPGMVLITRAATTKEAVARGWWFGAGYLIGILQWMTPEIGPGVVLIGGVFGCMWSPFAVAVGRLLRPPVSYARVLAGLVVIPGTWLVPEWIRSYQGLGGPWGLYGASQWQHPAVLALASVGGVWLVSVALLIANAALVLIVGAIRPALLLPDAHMRPTTLLVSTPFPASASRRMGVAAAGVAAFVAAAGAGPLALALTAPFPVTRQVTIALVQPGTVHDPAARVDASEALTSQFIAAEAEREQHADLIVWGESSVAYDLALDPGLVRNFRALAAQAKADIVVNQDATVPGPDGSQKDGGQKDGGQEKVAVLVSPAGIAGRYVKTRLVPFGEYIPFRQQLSWLTKVSKAASSNMIPGDGARTLTVQVPPGSAADPITAGILICFESAFPDMARVATNQGAQLVVYQSATSTFQGTWGPDQQASLAAIRAAETGRPTVQAALTGDSVAFDARGRQLAWFGQDSRGVITVTVSLPSTSYKTVYDQAGDYVMWSGTAISALAALVMVLRRRHFLGNTTGVAGTPKAEYDPDTGAPVP